MSELITMEGMGMPAVSVYLRVLRDGRGLTQEQAAVKAGVSTKTVERWEAGKNEPTVSNLKQLVRVLQGSVEDAIFLLLSDDKEAADGRRAAEAWLRLSDEERAQIDSILANAPADEIDVLLKDLRSEIQQNDRRQSYVRGLIAGWRADTQEP